MIIYTQSVEVVVSVLRRFPEINAPEALFRLMTSAHSQWVGLTQQVVAHAGNKAGVEGRWTALGKLEVKFFFPPDRKEPHLAWIVTVERNVQPNEPERFVVSIRHDNPVRDVRVLAAALLAEDEQKCTTTVGDAPGHIGNLLYALEKAMVAFSNRS